jgi:hypothetical protein
VGGSCTAIVGVGASCQPQLTAFDASGCGSGAYCDPGTAKCVALPAVGQSCALSAMCAPGSYCDVGGGFAAAVCKAQGADGAACTNSYQCKSHYDCTGGKCAPSAGMCSES